MKTTVFVAVLTGALLVGILRLAFPEVNAREYLSVVSVGALLLSIGGRSLYSRFRKRKAVDAHEQH